MGRRVCSRARIYAAIKLFLRAIINPIEARYFRARAEATPARMRFSQVCLYPGLWVFVYVYMYVGMRYSWCVCKQIVQRFPNNEYSDEYYNITIYTVRKIMSVLYFLANLPHKSQQ